MSSNEYDARFAVEDQHILVYADIVLGGLCKDVPGGRWDKRRMAWVFPAYPRVARALRAVFNGCRRVGNRAFAELLEAPDSHEAAAAVTALRDDELPEIPLVKLPPWKHQARGYAFARPLSGAMLAMDMGTGKSRVAIDQIVNRHAQRTLILAPKSVVNGVWTEQFRRHTPIPLLVCALGKGSVRAKTEQAQIAVAHASEKRIPCAIVINYEAARLEPFSSWAIRYARFDCLVLDEVHRIKAPRGRASMFCWKLSQGIPYRIGLTGTPMPHSPLDVFAQMRAIDSTVYGTSYTQFRMKYAQMHPIFPAKLLKVVNEEDLNRRFYTVSYRVGKEVLDLPPVQHIDRQCVLGHEARRIYDDLEDEFEAWIKGNDGEDGVPVTAQNVLVKILRMQQITGGFVRTDTDDNGSYQDITVDTGKADLLEDIMEDMPPREPVVVFCRFHHDLDTVRSVCQKLGRTCAELSGRYHTPTGTTDRMDLEHWQQGAADVLAVQIQSGGIGVDLSRARYGIYYSVSYSLGDYDQSLARLHRPGQEHPVIYYHLIAKGTIDGKIYRALQTRRDLVNGILGGERLRDSTDSDTVS